MKKLFYPAIFHKEDDGFWVSFPDFPECLTEGDNMEQTYDMAVDALGLSITSRKEEKEEIPSPSDPDVIDADGGIITGTYYCTAGDHLGRTGFYERFPGNLRSHLAAVLHGSLLSDLQWCSDRSVRTA